MSAFRLDWLTRRLDEHDESGHTELVRLSAAGTGAIRGGRPHPPFSRYTPPPPDTQYRPPRVELATDMTKDEVKAICAGLTVMFLIDCSGSMFVDHAGVRYAAAKAIVRFLREHGGGRVGVLSWTHQIEGELAPVDIKTGRKPLDTALQTQAAQGGNNVAAALRRAKQLLPAAGRDEHQVLVITDGEEFAYTGGDPTGHITAVHDALVALHPATVHVVLIDHAHRCTPEEEAIWRSLIASFTRLDLADPRQLCWAVAHTLLSPHGIRLAAPRPTAPPRRRLFR